MEPRAPYREVRSEASARKAWFVPSALGQLDELYDRAGRESILQNSALQVLFAANDESTTRYVSERLGLKRMRTFTRTFVPGSRIVTKAQGFASRALLLPEEVRRLGPEDALVFKEGVRAVRSQKIRYYRDRAFADRRAPAAEVPKLELVPRPVPRFTGELVQAAQGGKTENPVPPKVNPPSC